MRFDFENFVEIKLNLLHCFESEGFVTIFIWEKKSPHLIFFFSNCYFENFNPKKRDFHSVLPSTPNVCF